MTEKEKVEELDIIKLITDFDIFKKSVDDVKNQYPDLIVKDEVNYSLSKNFIWNEVEYSMKLFYVGKKLLLIMMFPNNMNSENTKDTINNLKKYLEDNYKLKHNDKKTLWQIDKYILNICKERYGNGYQIIITEGKIEK
jgi:hypothetical protein